MLEKGIVYLLELGLSLRHLDGLYGVLGEELSLMDLRLEIISR